MMDMLAWIFLAILCAALGQATKLIADCHRNRNWRNLVTSPLPAIVWLVGLLMAYSGPVLCLSMLELMNGWAFAGLSFATIVGGGLGGIPLAWLVVTHYNRGRPVADRLPVIKPSRHMS